MTKLLQNRVPDGLPKETIQVYAIDLKAARSKLVPTPVVDDVDFKAFDKMGAVKRAEAEDTLKVLKNFGAVFPLPLSLTVIDNGLSVFDNADDAIALHTADIADLTRLKGMGGVTALNMMKCCEEYIYQQADLGNEEAILAKNAIEKLVRSSDKKAANKGDKANAKTTGKTDVTTPN